MQCMPCMHREYAPANKLVNRTLKFFNRVLISIAPSHNAILKMAFYHRVVQQK